MTLKLPSLLVLTALVAGCGCPAEREVGTSGKQPEAAAPAERRSDGSGQGKAAQEKSPASNPKPEEARKPEEGTKPDQPTKPDDAAKPVGSGKPIENTRGPTFGLPLEIEMKAPEVPKNIEGPTPLDQLKKPDQPKKAPVTTP